QGTCDRTSPRCGGQAGSTGPRCLHRRARRPHRPSARSRRPMSPIRGILFDKDGTLIDFNATGAAVARKMALRAAGGNAARADLLLAQSGFDAAAGRVRADSVFPAGTNADVVALWHPEVAQENLAQVVAEYDAITADEVPASAVAL